MHGHKWRGVMGSRLRGNDGWWFNFLRELMPHSAA
jgi:hypothetical protein